MKINRWILVLALVLFGAGNLTAETWLIGCDLYSPPYNFRLKDGKPNADDGIPTGLDTEIVEAVLTEIGVQPEIKFMPWKRVLQLMEADKLDMSFQYKASSERFEKFLIIGPLRAGKTVFAVPKDSSIKEWNDLKDFSGIRVGGIRGYIYTPEFDGASDIKKDVTANNYEQLVKMLALKRFPVIIGDQASIVYTAKQLNLTDKIRLLPKVLQQIDRFVVFPNSKPEMAGRFAHGLNKIRFEGKLDQILAKWE